VRFTVNSITQLTQSVIARLPEGVQRVRETAAAILPHDPNG
jgi:hypothetical protein